MTKKKVGGLLVLAASTGLNAKKKNVGKNRKMNCQEQPFHGSKVYNLGERERDSKQSTAALDWVQGQDNFISLVRHRDCKSRVTI